MHADLQYAERNVRFGVREHAMGAICNGIAHHTSGLIPYCATFFIFTDYMRGAMRMSALSQAGVIYGKPIIYGMVACLENLHDECWTSYGNGVQDLPVTTILAATLQRGLCGDLRDEPLLGSHQLQIFLSLQRDIHSAVLVPHQQGSN